MASYVKKINLDNMQNIVFFDIDSTLSSSVDHCVLKEQHQDIKITKNLYQNWETISYYNYAELSHSSVALFAYFLKQTNSKAVCISSWNKHQKAELFIKELSEAFETISDFPDDWLLGISGLCGGDRWKHSIEPFIKEHNVQVPFVALDDAGWNYSDQSKAVLVDGRLGFNIIDYMKALKILNLKEELEYD